jgi:hypothetical protein
LRIKLTEKNHPLVASIFLNEADPVIALGALEQGLVKDARQETIIDGDDRYQLLDGFLWRSTKEFQKLGSQEEIKNPEAEKIATKVVKKLLKLGADPIYSGIPGDEVKQLSALGFAATIGPISIFNEIIQSMEPGEVQKFFAMPGPFFNSRESTPIPWAHGIMQMGKLDRIEAIARAGFDLETTDHKKRTVLFFAAYNAPALIKAGADPEATDANGVDATTFLMDRCNDSGPNSLRHKIVAAIMECRPGASDNSERSSFIRSVSSYEAFSHLNISPQNVLSHKERMDNGLCLKNLNPALGPIHGWQLSVPKLGAVDGLSAIACSWIQERRSGLFTDALLNSHHVHETLPEPMDGSPDPGALLYISLSKVENSGHYSGYNSEPVVIKMISENNKATMAARKMLEVKMGVDNYLDEVALRRFAKATDWLLKRDKTGYVVQRLASFWQGVMLGSAGAGENPKGLITADKDLMKNVELAAKTCLQIGGGHVLFGKLVCDKLMDIPQSNFADPLISGQVALIMSFCVKTTNSVALLRRLGRIKLPAGIDKRQEKMIIKNLQRIDGPLAQQAFMDAKVKEVETTVARKRI